VFQTKGTTSSDSALWTKTISNSCVIHAVHIQSIISLSHKVCSRLEKWSSINPPSTNQPLVFFRWQQTIVLLLSALVAFNLTPLYNGCALHPKFPDQTRTSPYRFYRSDSTEVLTTFVPAEHAAATTCNLRTNIYCDQMDTMMSRKHPPTIDRHI